MEEGSPTPAPTVPYGKDYAQGKDSEVLKTTLKIYGSMFIVIFVVFCFARQRFPRVYNVRGWLKRLECDLAKDQFGLISWTWRMFQIRESHLLDQCGLDALCLLRAQHVGLKLSFFGIVLSFGLLPIYALSPPPTHSTTPDYVSDQLLELTVAHVPEESKRLFATLFAAYLLFGYAMYLILHEFKWFTVSRVHFLIKRQPRNYTVYVRNLRHDYQTNQALADYFRRIFSDEAVLEAHVALSIPRLEQKVENRRILVEKLEHAINVKQITGEAPRHLVELMMGQTVNSIEVYQRQLEGMNREIGEAIDRLDRAQQAMGASSARPSYQLRMCSVVVGRRPGGGVSWKPSLDKLESNGDDDDDDDDDSTEDGDDEQKSSRQVNAESSESSSDLEIVASRSDEGCGPTPFFPPVNSKLLKKAKSTGLQLSERSRDVFERSAVKAKSSGRKFGDVSLDLLERTVDKAIRKGRNISENTLEALERTIELVDRVTRGVEDGTPLSAGFVTFKNLSAVTVAKQMLHSNIPFQMEVEEAPTPEGIVWSNIGRPTESIQTGKLLSFGFTATLCLFWTVPVSFLLSLTEVESLKEHSDTLNDWIESAPWIESLLYQLAPVMLWVLGEILYVILDIVVTMEGHVGASALEASLFEKLSAFNLIQTFFVASIAGTVSASLSSMIEQPSLIVQFLATTLPPQSTFFIQFMLVNTVVSLLFEMLRITQIWQERLRRRIWWNLTEKEQNKRWKFLRPLGNPRNFFHARLFADTMLYYMIAFVYTCLAPITCYFLAFCFMVQAAAYRHQFIYIYPPTPDSGGRLWLTSIHIMLVCMVVAEITLLGYFILKESRICSSLMIPLVILTILFTSYIRQRHFRAARELASEDCLQYDTFYAEQGLDFEFVRGKYRHPAMQEKELLPDNLPENSSSDSTNNGGGGGSRGSSGGGGGSSGSGSSGSGPLLHNVLDESSSSGEEVEVSMTSD